VQLLDSNVTGSVSLNGAAANSGMNVILNNARITRVFSVTSGNGTDSISLNNASVLGQGLLPGQPACRLPLKGGANATHIRRASRAAAGNVINGGLSYSGTGVETFNLQNYVVTSSTFVSAQTGNGGLTANLAGCKIAGSVSLAAAGSAGDSVTVNGLT